MNARNVTRFMAALLAVVAAVPTAVRAQETGAVRGTLVVGTPFTATIGPDESHFYVLELPAEQFLVGFADQESVNVALALHSSEGSVVARTDTRTRGLERFMLDGAGADTYRVEVTSVDGESGAYSLALEMLEPIATDPAERVDQLVAGLDGTDHPGGVIGVIRNGELAFTRAFGAANLAHEIPFSVDTRTNIGSTTKQFTAFAIMLLDQEGKLSIDDDVRTHLPELKDFGTPVTLRHLMTHTSGYREFLNLLAIGGRRLDYDHVAPAELIGIVQRQPELQNAPGGEWNYNNTAFGLLAQVVAKVGGKPFPEWMEENVFAPLGMDHTMVRRDPRTIVPHGSMGYVDAKAGGYDEAGDLGGAMGAGGIYTTVGDLAQWMGNLADPTLGGPETIEAMTTPYVLMDGDTTNYGFGLFIDEFRGLQRVHHGGADVAHRSTFVFFPELDAGYIVLSNYATVPTAIPSGVAEAFFGEHFEDEAGAPGTVTMADDAAFHPADFEPETFDAFAGQYALDAAPNVVITFRRDEDAYSAQVTGQQELELVPTSDSTFKLLVVEASVTFHREEDGSVETITLHQNGNNKATRIEAPALTTEQLAEYEGRYFSEEVEAYYVVAAEDGSLVLQHRRLDDISLSSTGEDTFSGGFPIATVTFERERGGAVSSFLAGNGRTRDVRFVRVP